MCEIVPCDHSDITDACLNKSLPLMTQWYEPSPARFHRYTGNQLRIFISTCCLLHKELRKLSHFDTKQCTKKALDNQMLEMHIRVHVHQHIPPLIRKHPEFWFVILIQACEVTSCFPWDERAARGKTHFLWPGRKDGSLNGLTDRHSSEKQSMNDWIGFYLMVKLKWITH